MIEGVHVVDLVYAEDDRGSLVRVIQNYQLAGGSSAMLLPMSEWPTSQPGRLGQIYIVESPAAGTVRGFHKHFKLVDQFYIARGRAKFVLVDDRSGAIGKEALDIARAGLDDKPLPHPGETQIIVASARKPQLLTVPVGVFHSWVSLSPNTLLVSIGSELWDPADEVRVPPDYFNDEFGGESPFEVKGR